MKKHKKRICENESYECLWGLISVLKHALDGHDLRDLYGREPWRDRYLPAYWSLK